jgi:hypothetical protein
LNFGIDAQNLVAEMLNLLRVLLHPWQVAPGCCLFSVESSNVRVKSSKSGSYCTNDTDKKAHEGHGVGIQFDKHQKVIRHKVTDFVTLQRIIAQDAVRCHFACAAIVTRVPIGVVYTV